MAKQTSKSLTDNVLEGINSTTKIPEKEITNMVSTGSTLLDLAISGGVSKYGGIPSGIIIELYGEESTGKSAIVAETCANIQNNNGKVLFQDPEARLDFQFCKIFGFSIKEDEENYTRPDTIEEVFKNASSFAQKEKKSGIINLVATDSLAALSTEFEMKNEQGDKMGGARSKAFSTFLRKTGRIFKQTDCIMICTNQAREAIGQYGSRITTSGGHAIKHWATIRIYIKQAIKIVKKKKVGGKEINRVIGIKSLCRIEKNSCDIPYREAEINIIFRYGIDDIRGNLEFLKSYEENECYSLTDKKIIDSAIKYIEENNLINELKDKTINIWHETEDKFKINRKKKK